MLTWGEVLVLLEQGQVARDVGALPGLLELPLQLDVRAILKLGVVGLRRLRPEPGRVDDGVGALPVVLVENQGELVVCKFASSAPDILTAGYYNKGRSAYRSSLTSWRFRPELW